MSAASHPASAAPDLRSLQGNIVGFNKDHQRFVFLQFPDQASGRAFLAALEPDIASGSEVRRFNALFQEIHGRRGGASDIVQAAWTNLAITFAGLHVLGAGGLETLPEEFREGMAARTPAIGDNGDSAPGNWVAPFTAPIHALAILAADSPNGLDAALERLRQKISAHALIELPVLEGVVRPEPFRGHEHFGFKDGISQPQIEGVTVTRKVSPDLIAAGEFIIGYPDQDGHISGQPTPTPAPGQPGYDPSPPPAPPQPLPDWTKDGSFLVFRRLRQNVQAFNDFLASEGAILGLSAEQLAAKLVGRWKSGAPLEAVPGLPAGTDPSVADPSIAHPHVLDDARINRFDYVDDPDGLRTPRAAHIRKTNPRSEQPPGRGESNHHRILRRGIPYGPEFQPGEAPYPGAGAVPDNQDRGLLFLCYQASIAHGFEFVQSQWANVPDFPQAGDGRDPIISQDVPERDFALPPSNPHIAMAPWVQTTGGEYFFAPSLMAIRALGG